jgi:hypothetical protein
MLFAAAAARVVRTAHKEDAKVCLAADGFHIRAYAPASCVPEIPEIAPQVQHAPGILGNLEAEKGIINPARLAFGFDDGQHYRGENQEGHHGLE